MACIILLLAAWPSSSSLSFIGVRHVPRRSRTSSSRDVHLLSDSQRARYRCKVRFPESVMNNRENDEHARWQSLLFDTVSGFCLKSDSHSFSRHAIAFCTFQITFNHRGSYEIVNDKTRNPLPLTFRVYNEKREALYTSLHNSQQGTFELSHEHPHSADPVMNDKSERWSVCMENGKVNLYHPFHWDQEQSEKNAKLVSLSILAEPRHPPGFAAFTKEQKTQYVVLGSMAHKIDDILHHMNHMRVREAEHRDLAEQTYSGLIFWTIVLFVCLVAVAVGQVLAIMRFFQAQKKLYF